MPNKKVIIDGQEYILQPADEVRKREEEKRERMRKTAQARWKKPGAKDRMPQFWKDSPNWKKAHKLLDPVDITP